MSGAEALTQEEIDSILFSMGDAEKDAPPAAANTSNTVASAMSLPQGLKELPHEISGNVVENRNFKVYNFRRPDKFSKDQLRALQTIHENFARQCALSFASYLRMSVDIDVLSVDQLTYDEFIRSMPSPITVNVVEMSPLPGKVLMGFGHEITTSLIDRMLGGTGKAEQEARGLTDIEQMLLKRVFEHTYAALEEAWATVCPLKTKLVGTEDSYNLIQVATPSEIIALITFEVIFGQRESGLMSLCIPYPVLESVMNNLSAQHIMHRNQNEVNEIEQNHILSKLHYAKTPIDVILSSVSMPILDLLQVQVGDVIPLDNRISDDLIIRVNHRPKFLGKPGTIGKNLAAFITSPITNDDEIEEGLLS